MTSMGDLAPRQTASRERTLLASFLLSAWAPLATGYAVVISHSTTQAADFTRRSVELIALFISWQVFRYLARHEKPAAARARWERAASLSVSAALVCSGSVMLLLTLWRLTDFTPGGNVYVGLVIAGLGLLTNGWFWRRYTALGQEQYNQIIDAQRRLYQAKAFVDLAVILALAAIAIQPEHMATRYIDLGGSFVVAVYLLWRGASGGRTAF